jgi:hypothetical protein
MLRSAHPSRSILRSEGRRTQERKTDVKDAEWMAERHATWPAQRQLHPAARPTRGARTDALSHQSGAGAGEGGQPVAELPWKRPISSWGMWPPTSWKSRRVQYWRGCWPDRAMPSSWQDWRASDSRRGELAGALVGTLQAHHRFLLQEHLDHIDRLDEAIGRVTREIGARLPPDPLLSAPRRRRRRRPDSMRGR